MEVETVIGRAQPSGLGVTIQGGFENMSSFADRFFWARHKANIGAPTIAEKTGCSQGLISNIEKRDAEGSGKYNDKFAKLFGVNAEWLRSGADPQPEGFNGRQARAARLAGAKKGGRVAPMHEGDPGNVVPLHANDQPVWAAGEGAPADRAEFLQRRMVNDFQDYVKIAGVESALGLVDLFPRLAALVNPVKKPERDGK